MPENPFEFPMTQRIDAVQESYNMSQTKTNNKNIFRDCVFVLEFDILTKLKEKQHWRKKITEHGGTVSYVFTRKVNYVVLFGDMLEKSSYKRKQAVRHNVPILRCEFITDCTEQGQILPTGTYAVKEPVYGKNFKKGRITKQQKTNSSYLSAKRHIRSVNLNAVKSWSLDDPEAPSHNDDQYEVAKYALLKLAKMVHVIEVHALTSCDKFRLYHQGGKLEGEHILASEGPVVWYLDTADEVLICFEQLYKRYTSGIMHMEPWQNPKFVSNQMGSHKLKMILDDLCSMNNDLDPDVGMFVEMIWKEAIQEAEKMLTVSLQHMKSDKVDDAVIILQQIQQMKREKKSDDHLSELVEEFYQEALPHKQQYIMQDLSPQVVSQKLDLCQLIYDVLTVSEATDYSPAASTVAKYRALRCHMTKLDQSSDQCQIIQNMISDSEYSVAVHSIFEVGRTVEDILYETTSHSIGNTKLLMHASGPQNLLGILSRGLLLPQNVSEEHGVRRTDGGKLGYGIYFSNSFETCLQYAVPSVVSGIRLLIICEVALGECCDLTSIHRDLTAPPSGFHSCHGVKLTEDTPTDFMDDEFVIYNTSQQRVKYVVLFTLPTDPPPRSIQTTPEEKNVEVVSSSVDVTDLKDLPNPLSKVTSGLISNNKSVRIPLKAVHIRAKVIDMVAKVVVMQSYKNNMTEPIEAKYVFPLGETAAVCGFEAFINGKHIIGEIKEKKTAHREYREAISKGHGAYLMDEEEPDVFTVSVGNLPPKCEVLIKVTYITELGVEGDGIALTIPATVAQWVKDTALAQQTQSETTVLQIRDPVEYQISLQAAVEMPFEIRALKSSTHKLKYKKTDTKAVVEIPKKSTFTEGFQLLIVLAEIHVPRMWVERHPEKDTLACMLAFYPEFEAAIDLSPEVIFLVDLSNSMKGDSFYDSRKVLLLALGSLPEKSTFNIVLFGSSFKELFQFPHKITNNSTNLAIKYIEEANPVMGCSDILSPLKSLYLLSPADGSRSIFLISDGFVGNKEDLFHLVAKHSVKNRLFCLGVGSNRDSHTLRSLANQGGGTHEYYNRKSKSTWQAKITLQIEQATRPGISQVQVEWGPLTDKQDPPLQAPYRIPSLFSASRQVVYGLALKNCTQAKLTANVDGQEFDTIVSTTELNFTEGVMLHQLAARAVIRDYEDGILSDSRLDHKVIKQERKPFIIELSKEFGIVTPYTSFVAIEERKEGEASDGPSIKKLVAQESVDILTYMGWSNLDNMDEKDPVECVEELLRKANIAESFSQFEAERCYLSILDYREDLLLEENRGLCEKVLEKVDGFFSSQDSEKARLLRKEYRQYLPIPKRLEVRTLTGKSIPVMAKTVAELKSEIMEKQGLSSTDSFRLIYDGKLLEDTTELDMPEDSSIFLVLRLRGGPCDGQEDPQQQSQQTIPKSLSAETSRKTIIPSRRKSKRKRISTMMNVDTECGEPEALNITVPTLSAKGESVIMKDKPKEPGKLTEDGNVSSFDANIEKAFQVGENRNLIDNWNTEQFGFEIQCHAANGLEFASNEVHHASPGVAPCSTAGMAPVPSHSVRSQAFIPTSPIFMPQLLAPVTGNMAPIPAASPAYSPISPSYSRTSPVYSPTSSAIFMPQLMATANIAPEPTNSPKSLENCPIVLAYSATSPAYSPTSPAFMPQFSLTANMAPIIPNYSPTSLACNLGSLSYPTSCSPSRSLTKFATAQLSCSNVDDEEDEEKDVDNDEIGNISIIDSDRGSSLKRRSFVIRSTENRRRERRRKSRSRSRDRSLDSRDRSLDSSHSCREQSHKRRDRCRDKSWDRRDRSRDRRWDSREKSRDRSWDRRDRCRDKSWDRRDRSRDRRWDSRERSRDRSWDSRDRCRDRSWDSRDRSRDRRWDSRERSRNRRWDSRDRSRERRWDSRDRSRDRSLDSSDSCRERSHKRRDRCRDRSWDSRDRSRNRRWDKRDRSRERRWDSRDKSRERSLDISDRNRDRRWDSRDRSRDRRWDSRDRSRDRSLDSRDRSRDRRWDSRDRSRDKSWDSSDSCREQSQKIRDRCRDRSWDSRERSRNRRWDSRDRNRERSLDSSNRNRDKSWDSRDRCRDRSWDSRDRSRDRRWDSRERSRNRSWGSRDRSRDGSLDSNKSSKESSQNRRVRSRDRERDSRERSRDRGQGKKGKSLDIRYRGRRRDQKKRGSMHQRWDTGSRDRSRDRRWDSRERSREKRWNNRDKSRDRRWDSRDRSRDRRDGGPRRRGRSGHRSWNGKEGDLEALKVVQKNTCIIKMHVEETKYDLQLLDEELQNSLCWHRRELWPNRNSQQREEYFMTGYLYCPQMASRNIRTCAVDIWVQPQHTERFKDISWLDEMHMNLVPEYFLTMPSIQPLMREKVEASLFQVQWEVGQPTLRNLLTSGMVGCIQTKQPNGQFVLLLVIQQNPVGPTSLVCLMDGETVAERLQKFVRNHREQVNEHGLRLLETSSTDAPYIDMWRSIRELDFQEDLSLPPPEEHGLWTLKDNLLEALGINAEKFEQFLKNQGFFSFPKSIQNEISPVLSTFLVGIFTFMHEYKKRQLPKWLCKCEHVVDIYPIDPSSVIVNLNCMEEILTIQFDFPMETFSQMGILRTKCTPYIRDLELGKNLTHCVDCILQSLY
uniref:Poly [ADP-ribose] polymerase n=1 Tax=Crassostrea virginica TaxID=6565 RepID=A0A8B8EL51_CRAVI|nr:uncharacterized protein LOC111135118 isoform X1 [Crassostrea virginica]